METTHNFEKLLAFLEKLPAISLPAGRLSIGNGSFPNGNWWGKFHLDLSWVIESTEPSFTPDKCVEWLEARLPRPVENIDEWALDLDQDQDDG